MAGSGLLAAYLIVGVDQLKRERAMHRLKARLEPGLEAFNLDERTASGDINPSELVLSLNTLPVGQGFRLVLNECAGEGKTTQELQETLIAAGIVQAGALGAQQLHASYFTSKLEKYGALEWSRKRWLTTEKGKEAIVS